MIYHDEAVILPETFEFLLQLQADPVLTDFFLVGGTALALQIGHRLSVDLDLFSQKTFDNSALEDYLIMQHGFSTDYVATNTLKGFIRGIKTDFLTHAYSLVKPLLQEESVALASLEDIGAMKLNAIAHSGNRQKDFYDLYFLLEHLPLNEMLQAYTLKYPNSNLLIPLKGIAWFEDIDFLIEKPILKRKVSFQQVKDRLVESTKFPDKIFANRAR